MWELVLYLSAILDIKNSDFVHEKAEWKGFERLSYTLMESNEKDKKFILTFLRKGNIIKLVTVSGFGHDNMDFRVSEDQNSSNKLLELKND
ncbi:hypothetical protein GCM10009001_05360 [Virgibacillus siamensis]|uniref:Uncharacterized protein n=1 Tax=Virgibacillus siamensis TaxID=480071 RepID=A0ABN1FJG6_9BACI